jgi:hypothetical protein
MWRRRRIGSAAAAWRGGGALSASASLGLAGIIG